MAEERRDFPALRRRRRYLEQEMYTYDKYMKTSEMDAKEQTHQALLAQDHEAELGELEFVLRYFERLGNGYHMSRFDWLLLIGLTLLAIGLAGVAVLR